MSVQTEAKSSQNFALTPAEVLAMRNRLAEWLMIEREKPSFDIAEALISSGWVTKEPDPVAESDPSTTSCSACGTTNDNCLQLVRGPEHRACCNRCQSVDTHNQFGGTND